jgi:hypothetical protein
MMTKSLVPMKNPYKLTNSSKGKTLIQVSIELGLKKKQALHRVLEFEAPV